MGPEMATTAIDPEALKKQQAINYASEAETAKRNTSNRINEAISSVQDIKAPTATLRGPAGQAQSGAVDPAQRAQFFQGQRDEANRQGNAASQRADDAMSRRFAAMGTANSGAAMAAQAGAQREVDMNRSAALNQVAGQELTAQEAQAGRDQQTNLYNAQAQEQVAAGNNQLENAQKLYQNELVMRRAQFLLDQGDQEFNKEHSAAGGGEGGACCFIFLEARYGTGAMDKVVRKYRDEHMTAKNRRGYYKLSEVLVPLMRKYKPVRLAVRLFITDPLVSYGKYHYGENRVGIMFKPLVKFWLGLFDYLGGDHRFVRENGELV